MEREVGKNEKLVSIKSESLKLESFAAVGKFWLKLENLNELGKGHDMYPVTMLVTDI